MGTDKKYSQVFICNHPLIQSLLTELRDKDTPPSKFRLLLKSITAFLLYEATKELNYETIKVNTVLSEVQGLKIDQSKLIFCPILRAGLGMLEPALETFPNSIVWHIGLYRDEETLQPVEYYVKLPPKLPSDSTVFILDPMLATGGSACATVSILKKRTIKNIYFISIIASIVGIENLLKAHSDIKIYTAAVDSELNDKGYIVPGLGDAGNRYFNTL